MKAIKATKGECNVVRASKIHIYPIKDQRTQLKTCFGVTRRAYNIGYAIYYDFAKVETKRWPCIKVNASGSILKRNKF